MIPKLIGSSTNYSNELQGWVKEWSLGYVIRPTRAPAVNGYWKMSEIRHQQIRRSNGNGSISIFRHYRSLQEIDRVRLVSVFVSVPVNAAAVAVWRVYEGERERERASFRLYG